MDPLVSTQWLAERLDDPALRIFDATIQVGLVLGVPVARRGRRGWRKGHLPGAGFADLKAIRDPKSPRRAFMLPSTDHFAAAMGRLGIGTGSRVVIYDARENMWAARLWWMLRAFGFDEAAVLDGGWPAWRQGSYPTCRKPCSYPQTTFSARARSDVIARKQEVLAAIDDPNTCLLNALGHRQHRGELNEYGRPGHIPRSINVSAWEILDRRTQRYRPTAELRKKWQEPLSAARVITYCGGGIASASVAFTLVRLGHPNVAVYDAGLQEWCADRSLPLELGT